METGSDRASDIAKTLTKEALLRRMHSYVQAEAKRKKVPEWSIVGHIFAEGSGVASALWCNFIDLDFDETDNADTSAK